MRLRKSVLTGAGITRVRRGTGFSYTGADGKPLDDAAIARIKKLVIPPAWKKVFLMQTLPIIAAAGGGTKDTAN